MHFLFPHRRTRPATWAALCLGLAASTAALAQSPPPPATQSAALHLRTQAAMCASCHGTEGRAVPGSSIPPLAGQPQATIVAQMKAFQDGSRPATVMHQLSKGVNDAQINALAAYFASVKP